MDGDEAFSLGVLAGISLAVERLREKAEETRRAGGVTDDGVRMTRQIAWGFMMCAAQEIWDEFKPAEAEADHDAGGPGPADPQQLDA